jgi:hypothetical protein
MALSCNTKLIYPPKENLEDTYERMQPKRGRGARNGDLAWPALLASSTAPIHPTETEVHASDASPAPDLWAAPALYLFAHFPAGSPMLMGAQRQVRSDEDIHSRG